jgi:hypothetical protein
VAGPYLPLFLGPVLWVVVVAGVADWLVEVACYFVGVLGLRDLALIVVGDLLLEVFYSWEPLG